MKWKKPVEGCAWVLVDGKSIGELRWREYNWRGWKVRVLGDHGERVADLVVDTKAEAQSEIVRIRALHAEIIALPDADVGKLAAENCERRLGWPGEKDCSFCRPCLAKNERRRRTR